MGDGNLEESSTIRHSQSLVIDFCSYILFFYAALQAPSDPPTVVIGASIVTFDLIPKSGEDVLLSCI